MVLNMKTFNLSLQPEESIILFEYSHEYEKTNSIKNNDDGNPYVCFQDFDKYEKKSLLWIVHNAQYAVDFEETTDAELKSLELENLCDKINTVQLTVIHECRQRIYYYFFFLNNGIWKLRTNLNSIIQELYALHRRTLNAQDEIFDQVVASTQPVTSTLLVHNDVKRLFLFTVVAQAAGFQCNPKYLFSSIFWILCIQDNSGDNIDLVDGNHRLIIIDNVDGWKVRDTSAGFFLLPRNIDSPEEMSTEQLMAMHVPPHAKMHVIEAPYETLKNLLFVNTSNFDKYPRLWTASERPVLSPYWTELLEVLEYGEASIDLTHNDSPGAY